MINARFTLRARALAIILLSIPMLSLADRTVSTKVTTRPVSQKNLLTIDKDMAEDHRQAKLLATVKSKDDVSLTEVNEKLIQRYEKFGFPDKYNEFAKAFKDNSRFINPTHALKLLQDFKDVNFACYRTIYNRDESSSHKEKALAQLQLSYESVKDYCDSILGEHQTITMLRHSVQIRNRWIIGLASLSGLLLLILVFKLS